MAKLASVFIVDDNHSCLEFLALAFASQMGVSVSSETQPVAALVRIRGEKPDLIMLDIKMPEMDGFGLLAHLRGEGNSVPVVMCSGSARQQDIDRAYAAGCNGYVEKPASLEDYRILAGTVIEYWRRGELPLHRRAQ
jgi:two-component system chemotaxis response regulator CheY